MLHKKRELIFSLSIVFALNILIISVVQLLARQALI